MLSKTFELVLSISFYLNEDGDHFPFTQWLGQVRQPSQNWEEANAGKSDGNCSQFIFITLLPIAKEKPQCQETAVSQLAEEESSSRQRPLIYSNSILSHWSSQYFSSGLDKYLSFIFSTAFCLLYSSTLQTANGSNFSLISIGRLF